jgi:hypothetical protein
MTWAPPTPPALERLFRVVYWCILALIVAWALTTATR